MCNDDKGLVIQNQLYIYSIYVQHWMLQYTLFNDTLLSFDVIMYVLQWYNVIICCNNDQFMQQYASFYDT